MAELRELRITVNKNALETLNENYNEALRLLARARLVMDHIHRDGIGPGFIKTREDIAEFLGLPSENDGE